MARGPGPAAKGIPESHLDVHAGRHLLQRLVHLAWVWLGISLLTFGLSSLAPGDPAEIILQRRTGQAPTEEAVRSLRREMGLDEAFPVRYSRWLSDAVRGDLGTSYRTNEPVLSEIASRLPATLELALAALLLTWIIGLPLGVISAARRASIVDHGSRILALLGASMPSYWLAYVLIIPFSITFALLPVAGYGDFAHLVLPAVTLGIGGAAAVARLTRSTLLEELQQDYIRTARAKGLRESTVVLRHGLRNALNPIVTLSGVHLGRLLAGAVIVETIFAWPGIGSYIVDSIYDRDYPVIQGFVLLTGTIFVLVNFLVDLSYRWLDPRVRLDGGRERAGGPA